MQPLLAPPDKFSFPSGHTMNNLAIAIYAGSFFPPLIPAILPIVVLVAFSRIYLRVHYPTDVLIGAVLGLAVGSIFPHLPLFSSL